MTNSNAFDETTVHAVTRHMNDDHADDTLLIVRALGERPAATAAIMVGFDSEGGDYEVTSPEGTETIRIPWSGRLEERLEIRRDIVRMYDEACGRLGIEPRPHE